MLSLSKYAGRRRCRISQSRWCEAFALGLWALIGAALGAAPALAADPLVQDQAKILDPSERDFLTEYHGHLLGDYDIDYRVVTARDVGDINSYAVERFEALEVGAPSEAGRGLLLVVDPAQDLVRLEVGYALEGVFPDAFIAYIEHRQMVPFFRAGRVADGILATTELIVTRAQRAAANAGFEGEAWMAGSGGAGATTTARLGAGTETRDYEDSDRYGPGRTPQETLSRYLAAMQARNADPSLGLYTPDTQRMLAGWVVTPAQMDNVLKTYRRCSPESARFGPRTELAVIRYPIKQRPCAPWFFRKIDSVWALDLTMMQQAIRFGRSNAWHFTPGAEHPYRFAFADWRFDSNGFPQKRR